MHFADGELRSFGMDLPCKLSSQNFLIEKALRDGLQNIFFK